MERFRYHIAKYIIASDHPDSETIFRCRLRMLPGL